MSMRWIAWVFLALLVAPAPGWADEQVNLSTPYLMHRVAGARHVTIHGTLGGAAVVRLDPNTCALNAFGDRTACTRIAARPVNVQLKQAKVADPKGTGRRLFQITGMPRPDGATFPKYFLVAPASGNGTFRLIEESGPDKRRIVVLESAHAPAKKTPSTLCRNVSYRAEQRGDTVRIIGAGTHRSLGWEARFEQLPIEIFPPQFKLVCIPPKGMSGQALQPYEVSRTFTSASPIKSVTVHDGNGKHVVAVTPLKK